MVCMNILYLKNKNSFYCQYTSFVYYLKDEERITFDKSWFIGMEYEPKIEDRFTLAWGHLWAWHVHIWQTHFESVWSK